MKAKKKIIKKAAKKKIAARKKKVKKQTNSNYTNAVAYLVSSEENEIQLMVASSMGLVSE